MKNSKKDKRLTFAIPDGLDLGDKQEGDTIELVGEFLIEPDGKLCLKTVNGMELEGYDEADDSKKEEDMETMGKRVMGKAKQAMG